MPNEIENIVIIGGGASGQASFCNLVEKYRRLPSPKKTLSITIIDKSDEVGGLAYSKARKEHFTNTKNSSMSINPYDDKEYVDWLKSNYYLISNSFPDFNLEMEHSPRLAYGFYLRWRYNKTKRQCQELGIEFNKIKSKVLGIKAEKSQSKVKLEDETSVIGDIVILCIGNQQLSDIRFPYNKCFVNKPWPMNWVKDINPSSDVIIQGASLTSIDIILTLFFTGHKGKITVVSKTGLFPKTQVPNKNKYKLQKIPKKLEFYEKEGKILSLQDCKNLIVEELTSAGLNRNLINRLMSIPDNAIEDLVDDIENLNNEENKKLQEVIDSLSPYISKIYGLMSSNAKRKFKIVSSHYKRYKHPQILRNALIIKKLATTGRLQIFRGDKSDIKYHKSSNTFVYGQSKRKKILGQSFINGLGFNYRYSHNPIAESLVDNKLAIENVYGGLCVNEKTNKLITREGISENIYAVGSITHGDLFFTNSLPINTEIINQITTEIMIKSIKKVTIFDNIRKIAASLFA